MKARLVWLAICILHCAALRAQPFRLEIQRGQGRPSVSVSGWPMAPVAGTDYGVRLEASSDLRSWTEVSDASSGGGDQDHASQRFFRARTFLQEINPNPDGADIYGYARVFEGELERVGYLTPVEFAAANQPRIDYLPAIGFDPRTARFWDAFNADPAVSHLPNDFRLNAAELGCFLTNGFVVSERLGTRSFGDAYYRIFANDLPVFISADSVLHAWHYSYQRMLEEMEETQLAPALAALLTKQIAALNALPDGVRTGPLKASINDASYLLAVARHLADGTSTSGEDDVSKTLQAIASLAYVNDFPLFGANRPMDFSQFTVRGHYERTIGLGRYFRTVMWLARVDFRMRGKEPDPQSLREFGTAIVLTKCLLSAGAGYEWQGIDDLIRLFVGPAEALNMVQLERILQSQGIVSLSDLTSPGQITALYRSFFESDLGRQLYAGDAYGSPFGPGQVQLPRVFSHLAQRFTFDGWAMAQVTFDRVRWNEDIPGITWFRKVIRRYASATDVAYAVLGNRQVGPLLAERMLNTTTPVPFRDGLPYAHNLSALSETFDRVSTNAWADSIYSHWLAALRALSTPTTDARFPEAMRTPAWAMRTLNTQLGSYTQLKHDTVLYAKQPYSGPVLCEYPAGFVEPVPEFWRRMETMANDAAGELQKLPTDRFRAVHMANEWVDPGLRQAARVAFCQNFAQQMAILASMAGKELAQQPFSTNEVAFIKGIMNSQAHEYFGPTYDGWYPHLFYKDYGQLLGNTDTAPCMKVDPLVTDIQTSVPDEMDVRGGVLHEGVGYVDMMLVAIDNGPDKMVYAGPMLSHYEFIKPGPTLVRLKDSQWYAPFPARPEWTRSYLVPAQ